MPISLLSLSDDLLLRIAYFSNRDRYVPFPSFKPYWSNFASEVTSKNQKDFFSLRQTCKRIYGLCVFKNLHMVIHGFEEIGHWINKCPINIMNATRRIRVYCSPQGQRSALTAWQIITNLFNHCTALEELVITGLPQCNHGKSFYDDHIVKPELFRIPPHATLSKLRSLSIGVDCQYCVVDWSRSLIPALFNLNHLRISLPRSATPSDELRELSNSWCSNNSKPNIPLQTIIIAFMPSDDPNPSQERLQDVVRIAGELFPEVVTLSINPFRWPCGNMRLGCQIFLQYPDDSEVHEGYMPEGDAIKKQNYLSALPPSHNLKHIDWGITVNPAPERPAPKVPKVGETKIDFVRYLAQRKRKNVDEMALAEYRYILEAVSNQIIENFPSVESGVFWEYNYERSDPQGYRWSWTVIVNHDDQRQAIIDYDPLSFNTEFLRMRLGEEVEMDNDKEDANHYADHDLSEPVFVSEWEIDDTW